MSTIKNDSTPKIQEKVLDEEEAKTIAYLQSVDPELEKMYLLNLHSGRRGILQRLFQSLIRENLIHEKRISWEEGGPMRISIELPSGRTLQAAVSKCHSLGRFDVEGDPVVHGDDGSSVLAHPAELLELLRAEDLLGEATEEQFNRFKIETQNGVANLTLALAGANQRKNELTALTRSHHKHTSLDWALHQRKEQMNFSILAFYEQWVVEGHPLHPGAKTKLGLKPEEVMRYSPEWGTTLKIALVAVHKQSCITKSIDGQNLTSRLYREYEGLQSSVEETMNAQGLDAADFDLIPVHPWQFEHTLNFLYGEERRQQKIVPIKEFHIPAQPLVSFRSFAPIQKQGQGRHHIKTAVNVQTTSAVRTVSPNSVENGPVLSRILAGIHKRENEFNGRFIVLKEVAGSHFNPGNPDLPKDERWTLQANLASILRENPENYILDEKEIPMPAAALIAESPVSGKPVAIELIEQIAKKYNSNDLTEAAILFIQRYAETSLPGFLSLMVRYGISLEGHMQNSVAVFLDGELTRILLRDFGGVRILAERLIKQGYQAEFYPGSSIVTNVAEEMRSIISYSVMQNHFAELISCIVRELNIEESCLWKPVAEVCKSVFKELRKDPDIAEQAAEDELSLFHPVIHLKALTTMRLRGDSTAYSFAKVPNPLAEWKGEIHF